MTCFPPPNTKESCVSFGGCLATLGCQLGIDVGKIESGVGGDNELRQRLASGAFFKFGKDRLTLGDVSRGDTLARC